MRVLIMGCGRVGSELSHALGAAGHEVTVIDKRKEAFDKYPPGDHARRIVGLGFDRDVLEQAGIREADAFIAVSSGDNSNIVSARVALEHFHVPKVVARIFDPRRAEIYQRLGISTVAMISWTTDQVLRRLLPSEEQPHEWLDPSGNACLLDFPIPTVWAGKKLAPLSEPGLFWLVGITRLGKAQVSTPSAIGQEGDILHFFADVSALDALRERLRQGDH